MPLPLPFSRLMPQMSCRKCRAAVVVPQLSCRKCHPPGSRAEHTSHTLCTCQECAPWRRSDCTTANLYLVPCAFRGFHSQGGRQCRTFRRRCRSITVSFATISYLVFDRKQKKRYISVPLLVSDHIVSFLGLDDLIHCHRCNKRWRVRLTH